MTNMLSKLCDTSQYQIIFPYRSGILLVKNEKSEISMINHLHLSEKKYFTVDEFLKLPINVYFLNTQSIIQNINEMTIQTCGFPSVKSSIGKTVAEAGNKNTVMQSLNQDNRVLNSQHLVIDEEYFVRLIDDFSFSAISFKYPWFTKENDLIGIFGCSVVMMPDNISKVITGIHAMIEAGLLTPSAMSEQGQLNVFPGVLLGKQYLSKREKECLVLLIQGKTIKLIAAMLDLSPRTVEHYIENIKNKFGVNSRSDLIEKAIQIMKF